MNWTFVELDDVGSTQAVAKGLASMGAPEGTTVVAKSQSSGEGRLGRVWASPVGGLYMSCILRPGNIERPELITLVAAVAAVQGIKKSVGIATKIRWPNDLMIGSRKLGGVIAESQVYRKEITEILVGIGVNCNTPISETAARGTDAVSLIEEVGRPIELAELKHSILDSFSVLYDEWKGGEDMIAPWKEHVSTVGSKVTIKMKTDATPFSGQAVGIEPDGGLKLENDGSNLVVYPEDIEWLRHSS